MKKMSLSGVVLFALVIPFIMTYRIGPGETPYWLFGIIFALLLGYLVFSKIRSLFIWLVIILVIGSASVSAIIVRHQTAPVYGVHDIILQLESAIQFFLRGQNPYAITYFGTPLEQWHYSDRAINPALFHFVMMPWYLLFSLPFYFLVMPFLGYFDGRLPLVFLFGVLLIFAWRLLRRNSEQQRLFLVLLAFNPATLGYFLEGRSDMAVFSFLFMAWFLLEKRRYFLAGIPMALAFATKQSIWPIFPFYLIFLWLVSSKKLVATVKNLLPFVAVFTLITTPFFLWEPQKFLASTVFYLAGATANSYPVSGYGWGMVLYQAGIIKDLSAYYPFWLWQLAFGLPLMAGLLWWLAKMPGVSRLIICYGLFTFVFWYFSRYFNNSHLAYLSTVFITAYFWPKPKANGDKLID